MCVCVCVCKFWGDYGAPSNHILSSASVIQNIVLLSLHWLENWNSDLPLKRGFVNCKWICNWGLLSFSSFDGWLCCLLCSQSLQWCCSNCKWVWCDVNFMVNSQSLGYYYMVYDLWFKTFFWVCYCVWDLSFVYSKSYLNADCFDHSVLETGKLAGLGLGKVCAYCGGRKLYSSSFGMFC